MIQVFKCVMKIRTYGYVSHSFGARDAQFYAAAAFIDHPDRRANHAMVALMDAAVGHAAG